MTVLRRQSTVEPTKAERAALAYLADVAEPFAASALSGLYGERSEARAAAEDRPSYTTSTRYLSWCRTSGSVMRRLVRRGFLRHAGHEGYTLMFAFTEAGRALLLPREHREGGEP
jgi:hypothetical protein